MASVPVTIIGVMTYTDVGVGGGPMPGGPEVSHPIAPGGPPPQIWPSPGHPAHPIAPGGPPPQVWPSPGHPAHPIAPGGQPPGIWGGPPNYIDIGGPGPQPGPSHPIVIPVPPGTPIEPGDGAHPSHPIVIPPNPPITGESTKTLVYAIVPGSGQGGVWFLVEKPVTPPTSGPKAA